MTHKFALVIPGILGLTVFATVITPVIAQTELTPQQPLRQRSEREAEQLNLTETQRDQMQTIWQSSRDRLEAILTPEQKAQWQTIRQQEKNRRGAIDTSRIHLLTQEVRRHNHCIT